MSHDRGCFCGLEPYEYSNCQGIWCPRRGRKKATSMSKNQIKLLSNGDMLTLTMPSFEAYITFYEENKVPPNTFELLGMIINKSGAYVKALPVDEGMQICIAAEPITRAMQAVGQLMKGMSSVSTTNDTAQQH